MRIYKIGVRKRRVSNSSCGKFQLAFRLTKNLEQEETERAEVGIVSVSSVGSCSIECGFSRHRSLSATNLLVRPDGELVTVGVAEMESSAAGKIKRFLNNFPASVLNLGLSFFKAFAVEDNQSRTVGGR